MDNYHFYEEVGKGKYSVVHKARKKKTINYFAVKSLQKCRREKLMNEVKLLNSLDHMNVLKFYTWYESKNHFWAIYEYSSGGSLLQLLGQDKKMPELQIQVFARDLVRGLHYLHSKGIVYCDLKPSTIILNEYGTLKYCDFGLARKAVDLVQSSKEVAEGSRKGTPSYMAPELFLNDGVHSFQSDMWSLGCLIYEMAAGRPPFVSNTLQELLEQIQTKEIERIPGFSENFHSLISSLLEKLPLRRLTWKDLISHPFLSWNPVQIKNFLHVEIPQQPHFKIWCEKKYGFYQDKQNFSKPVASAEGVDVLRLSMNALNNLKMEQQFQLTQQEELDSQPRKEIENKDTDFFMRNRDEIIDIGCGTKRDFRNNNKEDQENWSDIRNRGDSKRSNDTSQKRIPGVSPKYIASLSPNQNSNKQSSNTSPNSVKSIPVKNTSNKVSQLVLQNLTLQNRSRGQIQEESKLTSRTNALTSTSPLGLTSNAPRTPNSKGSPRNNSQEKNNSANRTHLLGSGLSKINVLGRTPSTPTQGGQSKLESTQPHLKNLNTINIYKTNQNTTSILQNIVNRQQSQQTDLNSPLSNSTKHYHSHSSNTNILNKNSQHFSTAVSPHRIQHSASTRSHNSNSSHNSSSNTMINQLESKFQDISQFSSNCNLTSENKKQPSTGFEVIERLLVHSSDLQVKPIIGHKDIEKSVEKEVTSFIKEILPFRCLEKEEIEKNLENPEVQQIFQTIFQVLNTGKNNSQIINVLNYFENIIQNSSVANIILNSSFSSCLLELLSAPECAIRLKAATSLGMLLRFATSIDNSLGSLNLPTIIVETLNKEIDLKVRRKLIATLGEYLFYAATQVDEDPNNALWHVQANHLLFLLLTIQRPDEDEELRFYASKTIENITTRSQIVGQQLCTSQAVQSLISLFNSSLNQELRASAAISLMQISRLNHEMVGQILQSLGGPHRIADILKTHELSNKTLQAIITLVNFQLFYFPQQDLSRVLFENENEILEIISSFLESQHTILRGKSILALSLFITHSYSSSLVYLCGTKFFQTLDRLARDNFKYVQQCFVHLKGIIEKSIPRIIQDIKEEINRLILGDRMGSLGIKTHSLLSTVNHHNHNTPKIILHGDLQFINVLIEIASSSQLLKITILEPQCLQGLFELFNETSSMSSSISAVLMNLFEIILSANNLILDKRDLFVTQILPQLIEQLQLKWMSSTTQVEWRFHSLKLIHDILCTFGEDLHRPQTTSVQRIHELLLNKFIGGILPYVLNKDEEYATIGLLSLKLLQVLVENQPQLYVTGLKQLGLIGAILQQFNLTASRTILKIVTRIVQVSQLSEITQLNIFSKSLQLFSLFVKKEQDQCYEDLLDIFLHISALLVDNKPLTNIDQPSLAYSYLDPPSLDQQQFEGLVLTVYPLAFQVLSGMDNIICDKAQLLIIYILYIFGRHNSHILNKSELISSLVLTIQQNNSAGQQFKRNTRILSWMLQVLPVHPEIKIKVASSLEKILGQMKDFKSSAPIRDILNQQQKDFFVSN